MVRKRLLIKGIVQGVGFRPFVYRLASKFNLCGSVGNTEDGATVEIEGKKPLAEKFMHGLKNELPPLASISSIEELTLPLSYQKSFKIIQSSNKQVKTALLPPDISLCNRCKNDIDNPDSRYHNYFLNSCTECGPRYSIIRNIPYDRANTSMDRFKMCSGCEEEFSNPNNRRYHAQPIACPECGPRLTLLKSDGSVLEEGYESIMRCAKLIKDGKIAAVKGVGGFHLLCDAMNEDAVKKLREKKQRMAKPFAVMFKELRDIKAAAVLSREEERAICSKERPIVVVTKKSSSKIPDMVAPDIDKLGVFLPYTALQHLLFRHLDAPMVATSANLNENPIITKSSELGKIADYCLDYDRKIVNACDDSILQMVGKKTQMLRLARGYAPMNIRVKAGLTKKILAVGANQKNSIAIAFENTIILSPHIGDLGTLDAFDYFTRTLRTFKEFYDFEPDIIVCDKHSGYRTAQWAKEQKKRNPALRLIEVQHHYAHILACMAEHDLQEKVLGFAFDGTGQGDDGSVWGGEVFLADTKGFERVYHIKPFRLIGSKQAVKEPKRVALSLLFDLYPLDEVEKLDLPTTEAFSPNEIKMLHIAWKNSINSPYTSSMGRIFDAFASLAGFVQLLRYEGESGLVIESYYDKTVKGSYGYEIENNQIILDKMTAEIVEEIKAGCDKRLLASKFINTIAEIIINIAKMEPALPVILSGGVFQNRTLLELVTQKLDQTGRRYYFQQKSPLNDGGIALGQIYKAIGEI